MKARAETRDRIGGIILAGGASRRMGGRPKALCELAGKPLVEHVIHRMEPQVDTLVLSVARYDATWEKFGLPQVVDGLADNFPGAKGPDDTPGPLAGLLSGMEALCDRHEWILVVPCDAPFVPTHLGQLLLETVRLKQAEAGVASYDGARQSTFSIWNCALLPRLQHAVRVDGQGGFKQFLEKIAFAERPWAVSSLPPFFNVNTTADLAAAEVLIASYRELR